MTNIADIIEHYIVTQLLSEDENELQMSRSDVASRVVVIRPSPMRRFDRCICAPKGVR